MKLVYLIKTNLHEKVMQNQQYLFYIKLESVLLHNRFGLLFSNFFMLAKIMHPILVTANITSQTQVIVTSQDVVSQLRNNKLQPIIMMQLAVA